MTDPDAAFEQDVAFALVDMHAMGGDGLVAPDAILIQPLHDAEAAFIQAVLFVGFMLGDMDVKAGVRRYRVGAGAQALVVIAIAWVVADTAMFLLAGPADLPVSSLEPGTAPRTGSGSWRSTTILRSSATSAMRWSPPATLQS